MTEGAKIFKNVKELGNSGYYYTSVYFNTRYLVMKDMLEEPQKMPGILSHVQPKSYSVTRYRLDTDNSIRHGLDIDIKEI